LKRKLSIIVAIGLVLLIIGSVWNFQKGLTLNGDFWRLRKDGRYTHGKDSVRYNPDSGQFDVKLNGKSFTADMTERDETLYMEFSDGWAIELIPWDISPIEIDGIFIHSDYVITPLDFDAMGCQFERAMPEIIEPFYDEQGRQIGQWHSLTTASGEVIEAWETWADREVQAELDIAASQRRTVRTLWEGEPLPVNDWYDGLFVNEDGAYLMNPEILFSIPTGHYESLSRVHFARRLTEMAGGSAEMRGHITGIFMFLLFYAVGTVQLLWPEEVALFGSRWKFRGEPELSDEGIAAAKFGAVVILILAAVMLFIPVFG